MAEELRAFAIKASIAGGLNQPLTQLIASIALSVVLLIAIIQSSSMGTTVGEFAAFVTAMLLIISPLKHLADINQPLQRGLIAAEMIFGLIDQPAEVELLEHNRIPLTVAKGQIEFRDIAFAYSSKVSDSMDTQTREVLRDIQLSIQPGEVIAFVGPSGSGKTTLVNLLPRFFEPTKGGIYLDGELISHYRLNDLRKQIGFVSQDTQLFSGTIRENLLFVNPKATEAECYDALHRAACQNLLARADKGLDTVIGEGGVKVSGGEKQRLSIARALLRNPNLLVFDEATSSLDSITEEEISETIRNVSETGEHISFLIAHRLSTVMHADVIYVLEKGHIIENGTHEELLQIKGLYYAMWRQQIGERQRPTSFAPAMA
jgi:subfamily B ATP-binding cassette protein MsbA